MSRQLTSGVEIAVIGGGLVGAALAYGLLKRGRSVALFDEGDTALRASRGNFGLVCAQGKGGGLGDYAPWAREALIYWPEFARRLATETGVDVELEMKGGFVFCVEDEDLRARVELMERLRKLSGLDFDVMSPAQIAHYMPGASDNFAGGIFCQEDGHANPLKLLRALHAAIARHEGSLRREARVERIETAPGGYQVVTAAGPVECQKVVLAAGLGNIGLARSLGMELPLKPMRGQILVTERCDRIMSVPCENVRQTSDGTYLLGGSWEDVGYDTATTVDVTRDIAALAVRFFPFLEKVRLVRSWAALRILSPDNAPIYDEIAPGAFLVTCHSGVSLAAIHAERVAGWLSDGALPKEALPFGLKRFADSAPQAVRAHG
jgi:glycine/D-amino acid oxidase-like deaminating enzyme